MPDVLIRDVSDEDLLRIDEDASTLGLSRAEYLRREIRQMARRGKGRLTLSDLERAAERASDLDDQEVMQRAWS